MKDAASASKQTWMNFALRAHSISSNSLHKWSRVLIFQHLGFRVLRLSVEELGDLGFKGSQDLGFNDFQDLGFKHLRWGFRGLGSKDFQDLGL
jgi:hypothetical protein